MDLIDILTICFGVIVAIALLSFFIRYILYCYLEITNTKNAYPYLRFDLAVFTNYNKDVKVKHKGIKKTCNILLSVAGFSFLTSLVLIILIKVFEQ